MTTCTTCHGSGGGDVYDPESGSDWLECRSCEGSGSVDCDPGCEGTDACLHERDSKPPPARVVDAVMNGPLFAARRAS